MTVWVLHVVLVRKCLFYVVNQMQWVLDLYLVVCTLRKSNERASFNVESEKDIKISYVL